MVNLACIHREEVLKVAIAKNERQIAIPSEKQNLKTILEDSLLYQKTGYRIEIESEKKKKFFWDVYIHTDFLMDALDKIQFASS